MITEGMLRTHHCGQLRLEDVGTQVTLCGWVTKYRDLGGLHFIDLRDKYGVTQLGFVSFKEDLSILKKCDLESVIKVRGTVQKRPAEAQNDKMDTGMVEVQVESLEILSQSDIQSMPFLPYGASEATEDLKLKYRYLDLRTKKLQDILKLRSKMAMTARKTLYGENFIEVETPILYKSTPEGARDYIVPSRVSKKHVYALPQSPQTLKQLLMIGGTDRYFQICRCFRDEDLRADRQPEFTQIDIEVSFGTQEYIKNLATKIVKDVFEIEDENFSVPSMSYHEAMRDYGCDKPDLRFGLKQYIVTDIFKGTEFGVFKSVIEANGLIKAMFVPSELGSFSRKDTDAFIDVVRPFGGKGVAFFKVQDGNCSAGISKFITDEYYSALSSLEEKKDGTWIFFADEKEDVAHACADALRRYLGKKLELIKEGDYKFLWVHSFPLLEWDEDSKRYVAMHHPFTMPKLSEVDKFLNGSVKEQKDILAEAYDIVCNGYEIGGGSVRIHNQEVQRRMFDLLGMDEEEINSQFGFFVEALRYGVPPHAGLAFGFDRMTMMMAQTDSIRDVIAFPKTTSASCMMSNAPSVPAKEQIAELHFDWN